MQIANYTALLYCTTCEIHATDVQRTSITDALTLHAFSAGVLYKKKKTSILEDTD